MWSCRFLSSWVLRSPSIISWSLHSIYLTNDSWLDSTDVISVRPFGLIDKAITLRCIAGTTSGAGTTYPSRNTPEFSPDFWWSPSSLSLVFYISLRWLFLCFSLLILFGLERVMRTKFNIYVLIIIFSSMYLYCHIDLRDCQVFVSSVIFIKSVAKCIFQLYIMARTSYLLVVWRQWRRQPWWW